MEDLLDVVRMLHDRCRGSKNDGCSVTNVKLAFAAIVASASASNSSSSSEAKQAEVGQELCCPLSVSAECRLRVNPHIYLHISQAHEEVLDTLLLEAGKEAPASDGAERSTCRVLLWNRAVKHFTGRRWEGALKFFQVNSG